MSLSILEKNVRFKCLQVAGLLGIRNGTNGCKSFTRGFALGSSTSGRLSPTYLVFFGWGGCPGAIFISWQGIVKCKNVTTVYNGIKLKLYILNDFTLPRHDFSSVLVVVGSWVGNSKYFNFSNLNITFFLIPPTWP